MTFFERFSGSHEKKPISAAAEGRAAEHELTREQTLIDLAEAYKKVQKEIIDLSSAHANGMKYFAGQNNPESLQAVVDRLSDEYAATLEKLNTDKRSLETDIKEKGGNPSDYIVQ